MINLRLTELTDGDLFDLKQRVQREINGRKKVRQDKAIADFRCAFAALLLADVRLGVNDGVNGVKIIGSVNDLSFQPYANGDD